MPQFLRLEGGLTTAKHSIHLKMTALCSRIRTMPLQMIRHEKEKKEMSENRLNIKKDRFVACWKLLTKSQREWFLIIMTYSLRCHHCQPLQSLRANASHKVLQMSIETNITSILIYHPNQKQWQNCNKITVKRSLFGVDFTWALNLHTNSHGEFKKGTPISS